MGAAPRTPAFSAPRWGGSFHKPLTLILMIFASNFREVLYVRILLDILRALSRSPEAAVPGLHEDHLPNAPLGTTEATWVLVVFLGFPAGFPTLPAVFLGSAFL